MRFDVIDVALAGGLRTLGILLWNVGEMERSPG